MPPIEVPYPNTGSVASPAEIYERVRSHVPPSAQAMLIAGNALRAIGVIAALDEDLRRPVLMRTRSLCRMRCAWLVRKSDSKITVSCSKCHADNPEWSDLI
jgi:maleate cis-trans isomerase